MSRKKVLIDNCTFSNFARTNSFGLIQEAFKGKLCTNSIVIKEIERGAKSIKSLEIIFPAISNKSLEVIDSLDNDVLEIMAGLPKKFSDCDKYSLAICQIKQMILLSDDDDMIKYCRSNNIEYCTTPDILRKAIADKLIDKEEGITLLKNMEEKANYICPEQL